MRKILLILLAGTMALGLVACAASNQPAKPNAQPNTDGTREAPAQKNTDGTQEAPAQTTDDPQEAPVQMTDGGNLDGGWIRPDSVELTDDIKALLDKALAGYAGLRIEPCAYLGSQVVAGVNHALVCRVAPVVPNAVETWAIVCLYEDLAGNVEITELRDFECPTQISYGTEDGGWGLATTPELTDADKALFEKAVEMLTGVSYQPVALLSLQVVAGYNKCFLCEATGVYPGAETDYALVYVYEDLDGGAEITEIVDLPDAENASVQIPNPFVDYATLKEAISAVGFDFAVPEAVDAYPEKVIQVMDGELIQVIYLNGDERLFVRKAAGSDDISGDYNVYSESQTVQIGDYEVTLEGENGKIHLAKWTKNGYTYAVMPDAPMTVKAMTDLISQIR